MTPAEEAFLGLESPEPEPWFDDDLRSRSALYAALARAQGAFPPIPRTRTVRVQTKTGGSYEFSYAPLDTVFEKVRPALSEEGIAVTQILDSSGSEQVLRTMLLHADGGTLESVWPMRAGGTPQEFGSALTYLRRYALVALLGIASEEDDDGNHASGNTSSAAKKSGTKKATPEPDVPDALQAAESERERRELQEAVQAGIDRLGAVDDAWALPAVLDRASARFKRKITALADLKTGELSSVLLAITVAEEGLVVASLEGMAE